MCNSNGQIQNSDNIKNVIIFFIIFIIIFDCSADSEITRTEVFVCSEKLSDRKWTHLSLSYAGEGHALNIFFNGKNVCSQRESKPKDVDKNDDDVDDGDGDDDVDGGDGVDDVNDGAVDGGDSDYVGDEGGNRNDEIDDDIDFDISNEDDDDNEKDDENDNNVTPTWLNVVIGLTNDLSEGEKMFDENETVKYVCNGGNRQDLCLTQYKKSQKPRYKT